MQIQALSGKRGAHASEHITHAARGHAGVAGGVEEGRWTFGGDHGSRTFQQQRVSRMRQRPKLRLTNSRMGIAIPRQSGHFAGMRGEEPRWRGGEKHGHLRMCDHGDRIRIHHGGNAGVLDHRQHLILVFKPKSWTNGEHIKAHLQHLSVILHQLHHHLRRHKRCEEWIDLLLHEQRHHPSPGTQSATTGQHGGTNESA